MAELELPVRQLVENNPDRVAWRAALASVLWEGGRAEEARSELAALAEHGFGNIPLDGDWLTAMTVIAEVCADLGAVEHAERVYAMLVPYQRSNVVIGLAAVCMGSAARYLGRLAATIGARENAERHFEHALEADAALKSPICLAHTQLHYARLLGSSSRQGRQLMEAAVRSAEEHGLVAVARRARAENW
jgi:tetratricopeptide (TPR) repeat protein